MLLNKELEIFLAETGNKVHWDKWLSIREKYRSKPEIGVEWFLSIIDPGYISSIQTHIPCENLIEFQKFCEEKATKEDLDFIYKEATEVEGIWLQVKCSDKVRQWIFNKLVEAKKIAEERASSDVLSIFTFITGGLRFYQPPVSKKVNERPVFLNPIDLEKWFRKLDYYYKPRLEKNALVEIDFLSERCSGRKYSSVKHNPDIHIWDDLLIFLNPTIPEKILPQLTAENLTQLTEQLKKSNIEVKNEFFEEIMKEKSIWLNAKVSPSFRTSLSQQFHRNMEIYFICKEAISLKEVFLLPFQEKPQFFSASGKTINDRKSLSVFLLENFSKLKDAGANSEKTSALQFFDGIFAQTGFWETPKKDGNDLARYINLLASEKLKVTDYLEFNLDGIILKSEERENTIHLSIIEPVIFNSETRSFNLMTINLKNDDRIYLNSSSNSRIENLKLELKYSETTEKSRIEINDQTYELVIDYKPRYCLLQKTSFTLQDMKTAGDLGKEYKITIPLMKNINFSKIEIENSEYIQKYKINQTDSEIQATFFFNESILHKLPDKVEKTITLKLKDPDQKWEKELEIQINKKIPNLQVTKLEDGKYKIFSDTGVPIPAEIYHDNKLVFKNTIVEKIHTIKWKIVNDFEVKGNEKSIYSEKDAIPSYLFQFFLTFQLNWIPDSLFLIYILFNYQLSFYIPAWINFLILPYFAFFKKYFQKLESLIDDIKASKFSEKIHFSSLCLIFLIHFFYRQGCSQLLISIETETFGDLRPVVIPALIRELGERDFLGKRRRIDYTRVNELVKIGPVAIPALIDALGSWNSCVRADASDALGKMGPAAKDAVPALIVALKDNDSCSVRKNASDALGEIGPAAIDAVPALQNALSDSDESVRVEAKFALKKISGSSE